MTEPDFPRTLLPSRWRLPALAFTLTLAACLGGESVARAETVADVAGPANAVLARLEERKADVLTVGPAGKLVVPPVDERYSPLLDILPLQKLALALALAKGEDPDAPRGLKKVTSTL